MNKKSDGKCGKGWEPGPGGKCRRARKEGSGTRRPKTPDSPEVIRAKASERRKDMITQGLLSGASIAAIMAASGQTMAGISKGSNPSSVSSNEDWRRKTKDFVSQVQEQVGARDPRVGDQADRWGKKIAREAKEKGFVKRQGKGKVVPFKRKRKDSFRKRLDAPRIKVGGKCGKGWTEGPGDKCVRSSSKSSLTYGQIPTAKHNQEFMAASLMGWVDKSGQPDTSKLKTMRPADRNMLLKAAQDYMSQNFKYDSADADLPSIKQEIESAHGFGVDEIYRIHTRTDGSLVGIGASGGDFFEFDITQRSVGVIERPDLTAAANERARGALAAEGIAYRGDSAFEYLRGREIRMDAPMQVNGKCGRGWKPGPGGKCIRSKGLGVAGRIGVGVAAVAAGRAIRANRQKIAEAYLNVRSGAAGSQARYEARKAATMAKRAAGKDARRAVKQGVSAVQGAAQQGASMAQGAINQAGREVRRAGVMARRAAGKNVRSAAKRAAGDVAATARGVGGQAGKVASENARRASVSARRAAGKDARRSAKQGMQAAQGAVQKVKQAPQNAVNAVDRAAVREMDEAGMRRVARNFGQSMQRTAREQRRSKSR